MDQLVEFLKTEYLGIALWVYASAFGSILVGFIGKKITNVIFVKLIEATEKTKLAIDDVLLKALSKPAEWAVVTGGVFLALVILPVPKEPVDIARFVRSVLVGTSVALGIWFAMRLMDGLTGIWEKKAAQTETKLDDQLVPIVRRSSKVFLFVIGVVLILQNLGYSVGSLLAGLGIGGVAVAMASKDTIANLFGSLVVFLDKPFHIGDWIEMGAVEGTVEEVGLRTTRVRTFANSLVTVPNLKFTTNTINNWSRMKKRRIKMTVGVKCSASAEQMDELVLKLREIIDTDEKIRNDFYLVNFDNLGPSSFDVFIYCFTQTTNWAEFLQAKQEFLLKIIKCVRGLGLDFAYPTQSLHVESLPEDPKALTRQRPL
ncbi:MAG: mechanosensitive ion channel family protein [Deltaproteobacteria bacterium]|nr:mechanosensitive ion channel family protein [Deltaproteobacteria bacterium]